MSKDLLSVIEQLVGALEALHYDIGTINQQHGLSEAALTAGKQALEQTREYGWSDDQMISFAGMILLQRNHADSIEQRLNRWKLHHKQQGNVQIKTEPTKHGEQEFEKYLKDCAVFSIEPDIAGAFHAGFLAATHPQATEQALINKKS